MSCQIKREVAENASFSFDLIATVNGFEALLLTQSPGVSVMNLLATVQLVDSVEGQAAVWAELHCLQQYLEHVAVPSLLRVEDGTILFNAFALTPLDISELFGPIKLIRDDEGTKAFTTVERFKHMEVSK